jgi:hypothetical protein
VVGVTPPNPALQPDGRVGRPSSSLLRPPLNGRIVSRSGKGALYGR